MLRRIVLVASLLALLGLSVGCGLWTGQDRPADEPTGRPEWFRGANPDYFPDVDQSSFPGGYLGGP